MEVTEIRVEYGLTQNLGDYSNVKLSVSFAAHIDEVDDPEDVRQQLLEIARFQVQGAVDDALEQNDGEVKYHRGPLFKLFTSKERRCVVIAPADAEMPDGSNWKTREYWRSSRKLRWATALDEVSKRADQGYKVVECRDGDLSKIPPMPDPGPAPLWHEKGLQVVLDQLSISRDEWDELAALAHVTADFLQDVRRRFPYMSEHRERMAAIRSGVIPPNEPQPVVEDDDWEDEYDEEGEYN